MIYQSILREILFIFSHFLKDSKKIMPVFSCSLFAFINISDTYDCVFSWLTKSSSLSLSLSFKPTLIGSFKSRLFYLDENSWLTREKLFPDSCQMR